MAVFKDSITKVPPHAKGVPFPRFSYQEFIHYQNQRFAGF
jgi:hypothetical protein